MAVLSDFVSITISADSRTPTRAGFGTPCILSYHTRFVEQYRSYTALSELTADGFASYDDAYRMAAAVFSQNPAPPSVVVGRLPAAPSFTTDLIMTNATEGAVVKVSVIAPATGVVTDISYTVPGSATTSTVATAVEALIEAVDGVTSSASTDTITVTPAVAGRKVHMYGLQNCKLVELTADAGYDDELDSLLLVNQDWYFVLADSQSEANVEKLATWANANQKMYFFDTASHLALTAAPDIDDVSTLTHTVGLWAPSSHNFAGAAWCGVGAAKAPGSINWGNKTLVGVTAKTLTATQKSYVEANGLNHYQTLNSVSATRLGKTTDGEWIEVVHGLDALEARVKEDVYGLITSSDKVPYTDLGFDMIKSTILAALRAFEGDDNVPGLLVKGSSTVTMPLRSSISSATAATRVLSGIRFGATLEGAINSTVLVGSFE